MLWRYVVRRDESGPSRSAFVQEIVEGSTRVRLQVMATVIHIADSEVATDRVLDFKVDAFPQ